MSKSKESQMIKSVAKSITDNYKKSELLNKGQNLHLPSRDAVIEIIRDLRKIIFPGYFDDMEFYSDLSEYYAGNNLIVIYEKLKKQIELALLYENNDDCPFCASRAEEISTDFFAQLPAIQELLLKDVQAAYDGDPAAKSKEEIIFSYPGLFAVYVYRIAHVLYKAEVPFIPRIMTEYAHGRTGVDINSGAEIGEYFFIDHGTGVVVGETTNIGNYVKLYQGVTLGALSTRSGQQLSGKKRHPTIENNVTIYSGASILGGETVIGEGSVIGGNSFITQSIPAFTKVSCKSPELIMKNPKSVE
ncbi:MAG: serine O-acetyltransferase [Eubacteriales bacterium]|nr:serine O-acetyltransferase [Eubacteriales bacterium]